MDEESEVQTLLLEAYRHIGEPDSLYGAFSSTTDRTNLSLHSKSHSTQLSLYEQEGDWQKVLSKDLALMYTLNATLIVWFMSLSIHNS